MWPGGDQEKIDGCVAMVMTADSRAYRHVVLKQNKSKEPPWMSMLCQQLDMDARNLEEIGRGGPSPGLS